jgi:bacterioferritin-associated ferredoxin
VYVCVCNGVTEQQIRDAICGGASSLAELSAELGVAAGCGTCHAFAAEVIREIAQVRDLPENRAAA